MPFPQAFGGSRQAYLRALSRRRTKLEVARGILGDGLRRHRVAAKVTAGQTTLTWTADVTSAASDTAVCFRDELPAAATQKARLARNEDLFRQVNEKIDDLAARHGDDEHVYEFFCECSDTARSGCI